MTMLRSAGSIALTCFAFGCVPAAVGPGGEAPVAAIERVEVTTPTKSTRERLTEWGEARRLGTRLPELDEADLEAAWAMGLSEAELVEFVLPLLVDCAEEDRCFGTAELADHLALGLLTEIESPRGLELVAGLAAKGNSQAEELLVAHSKRRAMAMIDESPCAAPQPDEVAQARAELLDFRVFDRTRSGKLRARVLEPAELDDLAYFMAAVDEAGLAIGSALEDRSTPGDPSLAPQLEQAMNRWRAAIGEADLDRAYTAGIDYVELLGWPGPLRIQSEITFAGGGAQHSYLLRDLAELAEFRGDFDQAQLLWRRANPSAQACGTGVSAMWRTQVRGFIRSAEAAGNCQATIAERLLDIEATHWWSFGDGEPASPYSEGFDHGTRRLVAAGFDLARLYRGALLTRNRNAEPTELEAALTGPEHAVASARLSTHGSEAWEDRIHAIEGFADTIGEPGLEPLIELAAIADGPTRARTIAAIGAAAKRQMAGVCDPNEVIEGGWGSNQWSRAIRPFGYNCATQLDDAAMTRLTGRLLPYLRDADPEVRAATATAFAELLALDRLDAIQIQRERERELERIARAREDEDDHAWVEYVLSEAIETLEAELLEQHE